MTDSGDTLHLAGYAILLTALWVLLRLEARKRRALENTVARQALLDPMTNLVNRSQFMHRLESALAARGDGDRSMVLLLIDLDGFRAVNDTLGHRAGDRVLADVSARLQASLGPEDTVARLGGNEFAVVLENAGNDRGIDAAQRIGDSLRMPFFVEGEELYIDASVAVAEAAPRSPTTDHIMRSADAAIYAAKRRGHGSIEVYRPESHTEVLDQLALAAELRRAIEHGHFILHYQPIVALRDARIVGLEALIRWTHPERGMISPAEFIPLAEETGLVRGLDRWVLAEACRQASTWHAQYPSDPPLSMSVNVSARQLQGTDLAPLVNDALESSGIDPGSLTLEITEGVLMNDTEATMSVLKQLNALGVRLAIDDFGIGFSSLSYLRRLPVDEVKIDRSFVAGVASGSEEWSLARDIIKLVHGLGFETVAEGVEGADQVAHLRVLGCRLAQGYYFARPADPSAITKLLDRVSPRSA